MEIRVYSRDMHFQGVAENQTSIIWTRKYFEAGNFEIYVPITEANVRLFQLENLVWLQGASEAGVIEEVKYTQSNVENNIVVSGRFLESYMDRRLIHPIVNFTGKTEVAMRELLDNITPVLPYVQLGDLQGFDEEITFQYGWKPLLGFQTKLAQSANFGFRFKPNFTEKTITFEIYKGLDRTRSQHERSYTEFSEDFDNLNEAMYIANSQLEKTVAYVAGEGDDENRKIVIVGDDTLVGYDRKELFVDARDLHSDEMTEEEYVATLIQRGEEKLQENAFSKSFECVTIPLGNFNYKKDYDLGDIVTVKKKNWNITSDLRITEIMEVYEHGAMEVIPTLGNPLPTALVTED